ncbi:MAG TPA: B12-binding domain-containing protein, partial [Bellilinea sp.]|nr:B12-binding domain-containing protein [Bellilinea sp.]
DVLRVWEKRYDLPKPLRSAGGHRLYSQYDIEVVKWLRARQMEGLSISRAVELWRGMLAEGQDPLAGSATEAVALVETTLPEADTRIKVLRNHWLDACLAFDSQSAEELLNQAIALYPVEMVCIEVLQWGLRAIGDLWYAGKASVTQEHFISGLAINRIEALILAVPQPTREQSVLIGCPAGELHTFPALLLTLLLRRRGWKVIDLGADVPADQLMETSLALAPDVVVLTAQTLPAAATLKHTLAQLSPLNLPVAYGGLVFNRVPALRDSIPAWFLGENFSEAVNHIVQLASDHAIYPADHTAAVSLAAVTKLYQEKRLEIEAELVKQMNWNGLEIKYIHLANSYFNHYLTAALELGSPAFGEDDLEWIDVLLSRRQLSKDFLGLYLQTYGQAVKEVMGASGAIISGWLESISTKY